MPNTPVPEKEYGPLPQYPQNRVISEADSIFDRFRAIQASHDINRMGARSMEWFRAQIKQVFKPHNPSTMDVKKTLLSSTPKGSSWVGSGQMCLYMYDAKTKAKLPYWDKFPLVFLIEAYDDGFLGLNLHYLPLALRAQLFYNLMGLANSSKFTDQTKLRLSYDILTALSQFKPAMPCIKRYLLSHIKSQVLYIAATDWEFAMYMPVQRFQKKSDQKVWSDSRKRINKK